MKGKPYVRIFPTVAGSVYCVCKGNARYNCDSIDAAKKLLRIMKKTGASIDTALRLED